VLLSCLVVFSGLTLQKLQEASIVNDFLEVDPCDVHIYSSITNMSSKTGQDKTRKKDRTGQDRTGQDKTRQDKPTPEKKRRDKTRQGQHTTRINSRKRIHTRKRFTAAPRLVRPTTTEDQTKNET
jgi:hypothetical protein